MTDDPGRAVLRRFRGQIRWAARQVARDFEPRVELADAMQEASVLVLTYAGLVRATPHYRTLPRAERAARGSEPRIRKIIGTQLRLDLSRLFGRQKAREFPAISLESLPPGIEPWHAPEEGWIARIDGYRYVRATYPYLAMIAYDELSEEQMAGKGLESLSTVKRRLTAERLKAKADPYFTEPRAA